MNVLNDEYCYGPCACSAPEAASAWRVAAPVGALGGAVPHSGRVVHVPIHAHTLLPRRVPRARPVLLRRH